MTKQDYLNLAKKIYHEYNKDAEYLSIIRTDGVTEDDLSEEDFKEIYRKTKATIYHYYQMSAIANRLKYYNFENSESYQDFFAGMDQLRQGIRDQFDNLLQFDENEVELYKKFFDIYGQGAAKFGNEFEKSIPEEFVSRIKEMKNIVAGNHDSLWSTDMVDTKGKKFTVYSKANIGGFSNDAINELRLGRSSESYTCGNLVKDMFRSFEEQLSHIKHSENYDNHAAQVIGLENYANEKKGFVWLLNHMDKNKTAEMMSPNPVRMLNAYDTEKKFKNLMNELKLTTGLQQAFPDFERYAERLVESKKQNEVERHYPNEHSNAPKLEKDSLEKLLLMSSSAMIQNASKDNATTQFMRKVQNALSKHIAGNALWEVETNPKVARDLILQNLKVRMFEFKNRMDKIKSSVTGNSTEFTTFERKLNKVFEKTKDDAALAKLVTDAETMKEFSEELRDLSKASMDYTLAKNRQSIGDKVPMKDVVRSSEKGRARFNLARDVDELVFNIADDFASKTYQKDLPEKKAVKEIADPFKETPNITLSIG